MSRLVVRTANEPSEVKIQDKSIWICRCGLSKNPLGLCDKSHKKTLDEKKDTMYVYKDDGSRYEVEEDCECSCGDYNKIKE
ncbi:hypothetical protein A2X44_00850 [candidate division CPR3 bacterium GWF2_35_18]|uniref:Iron-binding zinc finger CDGSH type domain-containing protein n=1 Tax=candidate division CPR3 bacterium GW2011_GWF2_35_18 TaxID=1618350 RepID=A0A0G0C2G3_UNCC3|nr:MAG: hypothetical protein UR67_C0001G0150 [candidate division CPR3 bacterium GW2011_GWF2_35_18]OGB63454.1 MAG: hypothetical protein A2X44_00850 [candidate division CPR3 bacterium GWF2_35_18]OGB64800.1 MAG: hypothetical protein A2250_05175 [candidate division CPR3 bacterium RIFOXYA2_FULL_35_13]OGB76901.1 MAG: hypothetical protein A2476_02315 [candidate division CPR3 bacterium RIFOXYC2_FULL_35_7]OGB78572.1 MAG: hypothetical protein A2296_01455 [candidate division CPR3 bacterium RIFOXYB2_FULL_3